VDQTGLLEALRRSGYEVKDKELLIREDGTAKGDWKVGLSLDAVALEPQMACAVLVIRSPPRTRRPLSSCPPVRFCVASSACICGSPWRLEAAEPPGVAALAH